MGWVDPGATLTLILALSQRGEGTRHDANSVFVRSNFLYGVLCAPVEAIY